MGGGWNKGIATQDWNKRVFDSTGGGFNLVHSYLLETGERLLTLSCTKCGEEKIVSSISLRSKAGLRCARCYSEECAKRRERLKEFDKRQKEWERFRKREQSLVQIEMRFCSCGQIVPIGAKVCDECKRKTRRQNEQRHEHKRRIRERAQFDKTITLEKLYERDRGVCYLCNKTCDWSDFQRINGNFIVGGSYPTVEHVKALCHGGTHTWDNVKLACFACNTKKGKK